MAEKTYKEYTYEYTRYNPQTGVHTHSSSVIAFSMANAKKLAKRQCDDCLYGSNSFDKITKVSEPLVEGKDYRLVKKLIEVKLSRYYRYDEETVAEKIY